MAALAGAAIERLIEEARDLCTARLSSPELRAVEERLAPAGLRPDGVWHLVGQITESAHTQSAVQRLNGDLAKGGGLLEEGVFERWLLLHAAVHASALVPSLRVTDRVKQYFCAEFQHVADVEGRTWGKMRVGSPRFTEMAKTTTVGRFPAGQFDWEVSGIPRADLLRVRPRRLPAVAAFVVSRMGGLGPVFFSHLNPRRPQRALDELEANRSYYQMARTMELQPHIRGFAACSWFRSPATHTVSPHLAWLSRVFVEHGGLVVEAGPEKPDSGVLYRSATRRRLYDEGRFKPTRGLVVWPRRAMLEWARAHPEFGP